MGNVKPTFELKSLYIIIKRRDWIENAMQPPTIVLLSSKKGDYMFLFRPVARHRRRWFRIV